MKAKTTLTVDEEVWRAFRAECIRRGTSASKLIQEFMRMSLKKWGVEADTLPNKRKKV
jgi:hypothetical protein